MCSLFCFFYKVTTFDKSNSFWCVKVADGGRKGLNCLCAPSLLPADVTLSLRQCDQGVKRVLCVHRSEVALPMHSAIQLRDLRITPANAVVTWVGVLSVEGVN